MDPATFGNTESAINLVEAINKFQGKEYQRIVTSVSYAVSTMNFQIKQIAKIEDRRTRAYLLGLIRKDFLKRNERKFSMPYYEEVRNLTHKVLAEQWAKKAIALGINNALSS